MRHDEDYVLLRMMALCMLILVYLLKWHPGHFYSKRVSGLDDGIVNEFKKGNEPKQCLFHYKKGGASSECCYGSIYTHTLGHRE